MNGVFTSYCTREAADILTDEPDSQEGWPSGIGQCSKPMVLLVSVPARRSQSSVTSPEYSGSSRSTWPQRQSTMRVIRSGAGAVNFQNAERAQPAGGPTAARERASRNVPGPGHSLMKSKLPGSLTLPPYESSPATQAPLTPPAPGAPHETTSYVPADAGAAVRPAASTATVAIPHRMGIILRPPSSSSPTSQPTPAHPAARRQAAPRPAARVRTPMSQGTETLKRTPLHDRHAAAGARGGAGARLVPFAGWEMPVQYTGIRDEHRAVRENAGIFDVSHMGEIETEGPQAAAFLQHILSNDVAKIAENGAQYSVLCNEAGGVLDDLFTYRLGHERFLTVTNASNHDKDLAWFKRHAADYDVQIHDRLDDYAMLAIQGPSARPLVEPPSEGDPPPRFRTTRLTVAGAPDTLVAGTGYTGEDGVELLA